uniref:DUF7087 domain-containing protein n=1 Tax=Ditylenchus dipsaci TaxID=166011 RepID=A0A915E872_9BILA
MVSTSSPNQPKSSMPQVHTNIHNVRTVSLVAIFFQIFTLYMDMASIHTATLIALLVLLLANAYMVFIRWYHREDERRDVQQLLSGDWPTDFCMYLACLEVRDYVWLSTCCLLPCPLECLPCSTTWPITCLLWVVWPVL